jgi:hypothetical protein
MVYKDLQKKTTPSSPENTHSSSKPQTNSSTQPGKTYAQIANPDSYPDPQTETKPLLKQPNQHQQTHQCNSARQELKDVMKSLFEQLGTMLNLLTVLVKLK